MHRIDTPSRQKDKFGAGKDGFTQGDPQTGTQATQVSAVFLDAIQEEIASVIEDSGVALDKTKNNQLLTAIKSFFKQASESVLGVLKIASQAQTNAGAADDVAVTPKKMRLGFAANFGANGFLALPTWMGGFILQWNEFNVTTGWSTSTATGTSTPIWQTQATAQLPMAFPTANLCVLAIPVYSAQTLTWGPANCFISGRQLSQIAVSIMSSFNPASSMTIRALSLGY
ncbi:hypothetical protein LO909_001991 [Aeromonas hydrophila]|nr:hypothetical protein [Aeromonas hydrophila]